MSRKFKSLLNLTTLPSDPAGSEGDVFFNTTEKALKVYNGQAWVALLSNVSDTLNFLDISLGLDYNGQPTYIAQANGVLSSGSNKFLDAGGPSTTSWDYVFDPGTIG